jgi:hypothetical protein
VLVLSPWRDGSDALLWAQPMVGHDRGLHRGVPHYFGQRRDSDLPSIKRHDAGAPPTLTTTTSWPENALTTQAMMTVPPRPDIDLPFEQRLAH